MVGKQFFPVLFRELFSCKTCFLKIIGLGKIFPVSPSLFKTVEGLKGFRPLFKTLKPVKNTNRDSKQESLKSLVE